MLTVSDLLKSLKDDLVQNIVFAGDTFDCAILSPRFIHTFSKVIHYYWCQGMRFTFVSGNHECDACEGNALDYLSPMHNYVFAPRVVGSGVYNEDILAVPYVYGVSAAEVIVDALTNLGGVQGELAPKVMVGHFGIYGSHAPTWMADDDQAVSAGWLFSKLEGTPIKVVAVGHYHTEHFWCNDGTAVYQIGALSPRSFADRGFRYGNVVIVENTDSKFFHSMRNGYVSGVRYLGDCSMDSNVIPRYTMNTSWYLSKDTKCVVDCEVVNKPKTLADVKNGAITYVAQNEKKYTESFDSTIEYFGVEEVIKTYIDHDEELQCKQGLLSDAISGVRGDLCEITSKQKPENRKFRRLRGMVR
jgi:DNA repair exonuclease SbcCD nuclease subunit